MDALDTLFGGVDRDTAMEQLLRTLLDSEFAGTPAVLVACTVTAGRAHIQVQVPAAEHDASGCTEYLSDAYQALELAGCEPTDHGVDETQDSNRTPVWIHTWTA
jgi:hypothetical protein